MKHALCASFDPVLVTATDDAAQASPATSSSVFINAHSAHPYSLSSSHLIFTLILLATSTFHFLVPATCSNDYINATDRRYHVRPSGGERRASHSLTANGSSSKKEIRLNESTKSAIADLADLVDTSHPLPFSEHPDPPLRPSLDELSLRTPASARTLSPWASSSPTGPGGQREASEAGAEGGGGGGAGGGRRRVIRTLPRIDTSPGPRPSSAVWHLLATSGIDAGIRTQVLSYMDGLVASNAALATGRAGMEDRVLQIESENRVLREENGVLDLEVRLLSTQVDELREEIERLKTLLTARGEKVPKLRANLRKIVRP